MRTTSIVAHVMRTFCVIVRNGGAFENLGKTGGGLITFQVKYMTSPMTLKMFLWVAVSAV